MDEYERIEEELSQVYGQYVVKIRCLAYLEEQLEELERTQKIEFNVSECFLSPARGSLQFNAHDHRTLERIDVINECRLQLNDAQEVEDSYAT